MATHLGAAVRSVLQAPDLRRVIVAWGLSVVAETGSLVALLVVAYEVGGAALVATFVALRTLPALVIGPALIARSDHGRRHRWLAAVLALRAALLSAAVVALLLDARGAALLLGGAAGLLFVTHRPMHAAMLPFLARTPAQLTASNAVSAFAESAGTLLGPLLVGLLLSVGPPSWPLLAAAGLLALAASVVARVGGMPLSSTASSPKPTLRGAARDLSEGLRALRRPSMIVPLIAAQTLARGVLVVCVVVLAVEEFGLGDPGVGWLSATLGFGGLLGSLLAAGVVTANRLGRSYVSGVALWGLPMLAVGIWTQSWLGFVGALVIGLGNAVLDVGAFTLVARTVPSVMLGRAFAAFEAVIVLSATVGAWLAGWALPKVGVSAVLAVVGAFLVLVAALFARQAQRVDAAQRPPEHVEHLRRCEALELLPLSSIEHLATVATEYHYPAGQTVMVQGEPGQDFQVVVTGRAAVDVDGTRVAVLTEGDGFGEVALLRDVPRTATVRATTALTTVSVQRRDFLCYVTGHPAAAAAVERLAAARVPPVSSA